jgi:hypothetical protein
MPEKLLTSEEGERATLEPMQCLRRLLAVQQAAACADGDQISALF